MRPTKLEEVIIGSRRARDEFERVRAEVDVGVEISFQSSRGQRLLCQAYVSQLQQTAGRMSKLMIALESEAMDTARLAAAEGAELRQRLQRLEAESEEREAHHCSSLARSEAAHVAQVERMQAEIVRIHRWGEGKARLSEDVQQLKHSLESSRAETCQIWMHTQSDRHDLTNEVDTLRADNTRLNAELEQSRANEAKLEARMQGYEQVSMHRACTICLWSCRMD